MCQHVGNRILFFFGYIFSLQNNIEGVIQMSEKKIIKAILLVLTAFMTAADTIMDDDSWV